MLDREGLVNAQSIPQDVGVGQGGKHYSASSAIEKSREKQLQGLPNARHNITSQEWNQTVLVPSTLFNGQN